MSVRVAMIAGLFILVACGATLVYISVSGLLRQESLLATVAGISIGVPAVGVAVIGLWEELGSRKTTQKQ